MRTDGGIPDTNWKELYQNAMLETDPAKMPQRFAKAQRAVLDRVEELHTKPVCDENRLLQDALRFLHILQDEVSAEDD